MKKEYTKPSMMVTCYNALDNTNLTRNLSAINVTNYKAGKASSQSYTVNTLD